MVGRPHLDLGEAMSDTLYTAAREFLATVNPDAVEWVGLEPACIGVARQFNTYRFAYDRDKIIEHLMQRDGMTFSEAHEHYDFNIVGGWVGEHTPIVIERIEL